MQGAFEIEPCAGGRSGDCLQQQAATEPVEWDDNANPYTIGGNLSWANYTVSADAMMEQAGAVQLLGRVGTMEPFDPADINDYYLQLSNTGAWSIVRNSTSGTLTTLASGTVTAPGLDTWQQLALTFNGDTISAAINGTTVGTVTDSAYASGMIGLGTSGYQTDQFSDLSTTLVGSATPTGEVIAGDDTAECVDDNAGSSTPGTKVQMWDCNDNATSQQWTMESNGTIGINGQCLDITGANDANGDADRGVDLQRRRQPAVARRQRRAGQPGLGHLPRRSRRSTRPRAPSWTCGPATAASNQQWSVP